MIVFPLNVRVSKCKTFTRKVPIRTPHGIVWELQTYLSSAFLEKVENLVTEGN